MLAAEERSAEAFESVTGTSAAATLVTPMDNTIEAARASVVTLFNVFIEFFLLFY
jgi:hypothetical protein